jgi:hypothetical protein
MSLVLFSYNIREAERELVRYSGGQRPRVSLRHGRWNAPRLSAHPLFPAIEGKPLSMIDVVMFRRLRL